MNLKKKTSASYISYDMLYNNNFYEKKNARFTYLLKLQKSQVTKKITNKLN